MASRNPLRQALFAFLLLAGLFAAALASIRPAGAQAGGWSPPRLVFEGPGRLQFVDLVADKFGQVHGFWSYAPGGLGSRSATQIFHTRVDVTNWQPTDVMLTNSNPTGLVAANLDPGLLVLWGGSNYGLANNPPRATARDWLGPFAMQDAFWWSAVASAPDGAVWQIYSPRETPGVYVQRLDPATGYWDAPLLVGGTVNINTVPDAMNLAISPQGIMHAVWTEYQLPDGWPPQGLYYARSIDNGRSWTTPRPIAPANYNQPNVITGPNGQVYLAWTGIAGTGGKYFQESLDGGQTWGEVIDIAKTRIGGSEGPPSMALDGAGQLHVVLSDDGCIWHFEREADGQFAPGDCISASLPRQQLKEFPVLAISQGNKMHVLFWTTYTQLWHVTRELDIPALPAEPTPTAKVVTPTAVAVTSTPPPTATHLPDLGPAPSASDTTAAGRTALIASTAPVVLLFAAIIWWNARKRR